LILPSETKHFATLRGIWLVIPNFGRLTWASDFPHNGSTRPRSQMRLDKHTRGLSAQERNCIAHDNVAEL
jgi:predicted TIM-barrel fold metal-dependent hydrolase